MPMINVLLWVSLLLLAGLTYLLVSAYNHAEEQAALEMAGLFRRYPGLAPDKRRSAIRRPAGVGLTGRERQIRRQHQPPLVHRSESKLIRFFEIADRPICGVSPSAPEYDLPRAIGSSRGEGEIKGMAAANDCHHCA